MFNITDNVNKHCIICNVQHVFRYRLWLPQIIMFWNVLKGPSILFSKKCLQTEKNDKYHNTTSIALSQSKGRSYYIHEIDKAHRKFIFDMLEVNGTTSNNTTTNQQDNYRIGKKYWKYVKARKRETVGVSTLKVNGETIENSKGKADALNEQFKSVFTKEDLDNFPQIDDSGTPDIPNLNISTEGLIKLLKAVNPNKANGPDNISCRILKEAAESISPYLQLIFIKSIEEHNVPKDWLVANVTALFKKGDKSQPVNYRPVSLTSVPCKIMEHVIFKHIMNHLDKHNILVDFQHGFRNKRSCESQLVITTEDIARNLDNNQQVDMLILDFSKAFDTVPHKRLLKKLESYGINGNILSWLEAWLTQREQQVTIEGDKSSTAKVTSGVPQGTVLGTLMFLLYINDIGNDITSKIRLFADDSLLCLAISTKDDCKRLQQDLDRMVNWTKTWQMIFNPLKCFVLKITKRRKQ